MSRTLRKGIALGRRARRGRHLGADTVLGQQVRIVARRGRLAGICAAVVAVIDVQRTRRRHYQQRAQLGASHAAQGDVCKAREELVAVLIGRRPPPGVLIVEVLVGAHHIERHDRHHPVGAYGAGVGRPEIGRPDERVDPIGRLLRTQRCRENGCGERSS